MRSPIILQPLWEINRAIVLVPGKPSKPRSNRACKKPWGRSKKLSLSNWGWVNTFHIKISCNHLENRAPFWCQKCNNRPFPSSPWPLFQYEDRCSAFDMEIIFHSHANKTRFHKKGCAPSLILKVRVFGTRKWPIILVLFWGGAFGHIFKPQTVRFLFECQVLPWGICSFSKTKWQIPGGEWRARLELTESLLRVSDQ